MTTRPSRIVAATLTALAVVTAVIRPSPATAQAYPSKPVRLVVPFPPGGIVDIVARLTVAELERGLGQRVIVENKPGAGGNIGADAVAKAAPDGYTLGLLSQGIIATNRWLFQNMPFDPAIDLAPIAPIADSPQVVAVHTNVPAADIRAFIALAKREPGKINYASAGNGTGPHLAGVHFSRLAGVEMVHVPYRGAAPAMTDLASGQVHAILIGLAAFQGQLKAGTVRALAVMAPGRLAALPDVPTMAESGFAGYELTSWYGLFAPKATPAEIVAQLNRHIQAMLGNADVLRRLSEIGMEPLRESPAAFALRIAKDQAISRDIVAAAKLKLE